MASMRIDEDSGKDTDSVVTNVAAMLAAARESVFVSTALSSARSHPAQPEASIFDRLKPAFMTAAANGAHTRVLFDSDVALREIRDHHEWLFDLAGTTLRRSNHHVPHWVIVDDTNFRLEKPHDLGRMKRDNLRIYDCDPIIAEVLVGDANRMWVGADAVTKD